MFERSNSLNSAAVTRGGGWMIGASVAVALATISAPRLHVVAGARAARAALGTFLGASTLLMDERISIAMASSRGVPIRLPFAGVLELDVTVVGGPLVNVHLISATDWDAFQKAEGRVLGGRFRFDFPQLQALATGQARLLGRLSEGPYFIIIERSAPQMRDATFT